MILSAWRKEMTRNDMSNFDNRARSAQRRIGVGLAAIAGAVAALALTLTATSPAAQADTVDLPDFPVPTGGGTDYVQLGVPPIFTESTYDEQATYTDLLGDKVDTSTLNSPLQYVVYSYPGTNPTIAAEGITDPNPIVATLPGGEVGGSTFGATVSAVGSGGLFNLYESTPFYPTGGGDTPAINDTWLYDTTSVGFPTDSTIAFGVQYLDLPDAATPVDELNFFGSGGDILFSIPVTGDLLSSL
jgi:hypothetical protein